MFVRFIFCDILILSIQRSIQQASHYNYTIVTEICQLLKISLFIHLKTHLLNSNMLSFFRFVNKRVIYRLGIFSLTHAQVHVTDISVVNVHVDELSSAPFSSVFLQYMHEYI
jgi:hypothetical protein